MQFILSCAWHHHEVQTFAVVTYGSEDSLRLSQRAGVVDTRNTIYCVERFRSRPGHRGLTRLVELLYF